VRRARWFLGRARPVPIIARLSACTGTGIGPALGGATQPKGRCPMGYRKLTDAERADRRQADRERLEDAARALLSSDGWQRWVRVRSTNGLARYSFGNQLLIAMQRPDATYVAGFRAFLELNRCVRKGEHAIRILAPMSVRDRVKHASEAETTTNGNEPRRTVFRAVPVFDVSQTDPLPGTEPVPLVPPCEPIEGDTHVHLLAPLERFATELGYSVTERELDGSADGWCDSEKRDIVINSELSANARVRVLVHELAHALGVGYRDYGRGRAEVLVDTVTYIVCGSVGLDVSGSSVPYVAGWGESGELDAIRRYAETIDAIARRIEDTLAPKSTGTAAAGVPVAAPRDTLTSVSPPSRVV
jgi:N-terminal domain of anti-restriction factor ArdC